MVSTSTRQTTGISSCTLHMYIYIYIHSSMFCVKLTFVYCVLCREMQNRLDLQSEELQKKAQEMTEMAERVDLLKAQIGEITEFAETTQKNLQQTTEQMNRVQNRFGNVIEDNI